MRRILPVLAIAVILLAWPAPAVPFDDGNKADLDRAIDRALEYLELSQDADGGWRANGANKDTAVTSLCVMAYLSAGHVPGEGRYGKVVERGVRWVLDKQADNGLLAVNAGSYEMYHHGICTLMLAEVAGMTEGKLAEEVRQKLERAIKLTLKAQRKTGTDKGGWRYRWNSTDSDISVTGWQLLSLRGAKNLGCDIPADAIADAVDYMKRCQDKTTGGFRYQPGSRLTVACTGTCIVGLELCGKEHHLSDDVKKAGSYLLKDANMPKWGQPHFYYCVYYCSQAAFQLGGNEWSYYRPRLHKELLGHQKSNGAWDGGDTDARFGANYCTAMAVLTLTPEYRFLPIYQRGDDNEKKDDKK